MNKICVYIYSYKERDLVNFVEKLISKSSKNNQIDFFISDQNNLTRLKYFIGQKNVSYSVIWWDELISPVFHTGKCINDNSNNGYDYCLILKREFEVSDNWDKNLVDALPNQGVLSGVGSNDISIKNNFYINRTNIESDSQTETNYIDQNFIFAKFSDIKDIIWPIQLKYYGVDEYLSIDFINRGLKIYSLPSSYKYISPPLDKRGYVPFSLNHNYNDLIKLLKENKTDKLQYQDPTLFLSKHNIDLEKLYKLPFDFNDIEYDRSSSLDSSGGRRYIEKINQVS